jgi:hypothetical protein
MVRDNGGFNLWLGLTVVLTHGLGVNPLVKLQLPYSRLQGHVETFAKLCDGRLQCYKASDVH